MFNIFKKEQAEKESNHPSIIAVACLLIHSARIDENYNQPSLNIGYKLKDGASISVKILNSTFALTSNKDGINAWLMTEDEEEKLVEVFLKV